MTNLIIALIVISQVEQVIPKDSYKLGPGDQIEVFVNSKISYSYNTIVDLNGQIELYSYQFGTSGLSMALKTGPNLQIPQPLNLAKSGYMYVAGRTISDVEKMLVDSLKEVLSGKISSVKIRLIRARTFMVPVLGKVVHPGIYPATPLMRVSALIYQAGGIRTDGDPSSIIIKKGDIIIDTANLNLFAFKARLSENPFISENVQIFIPELKRWVFVYGAINGSPFESVSYSSDISPDVSEAPPKISSHLSTGKQLSRIGVAVPFNGKMTVGDAIDFAGGPTASADMENIVILRNGRHLKADLDTPVEVFDTVLVPFIPKKVYVTGQVKAPGAFDFKPGLKVGDYIGMAGGLTERARNKIIVFSREGDKFRATLDYEVQPGDRIVVPEKVLRWWQDYLQILAVISSVAVTWLTLNR